MTTLLLGLLATAPISLPEVRAQSRDQNSAALLADLTHANAVEQRRLAVSAIYPQVYLSSSATFNVQGPQNQTNVVPVVGPDLSLGFQRETVTIPSASYGFFDTSLNVQQLIYDGGKWWTQISQAGEQERAALNQLEEQRNVSEFEGVRRFYELLRAQKSVDVLGATVKRSGEQLDRAHSMFEAGRALKGDVYAAQVTLGTDRISLLTQQGTVTNAQADLAIWMGHPGHDPLLASDPGTLDGEPGASPPLEDSLSAARQNRPLLHSLADQVHAAELGVTLARSGFLPRLSASAAIGRNGPGLDPVYTTPNRQNYLGLGLQLRWDLFSGFATDAAVQQARVAKGQAEVNLAEAVREVEGDVAKSVAAFSYAKERWRIAVENRQAATDGLALASQRYKAGAGSFLEIQDAQLKLTQTELTVLSSRIDIEIARANVDRVLGKSGVAR